MQVEIKRAVASSAALPSPSTSLRQLQNSFTHLRYIHPRPATMSDKRRKSSLKDKITGIKNTIDSRTNRPKEDSNKDSPSNTRRRKSSSRVTSLFASSKGFEDLPHGNTCQSSQQAVPSNLSGAQAQQYPPFIQNHDMMSRSSRKPGYDPLELPEIPVRDGKLEYNKTNEFLSKISDLIARFEAQELDRDDDLSPEKQGYFPPRLLGPDGKVDYGSTDRYVSQLDDFISRIESKYPDSDDDDDDYQVPITIPDSGPAGLPNNQSHLSSDQGLGHLPQSALTPVLEDPGEE